MVCDALVHHSLVVEVPGAVAAEFIIPKSIAVDFGPSDSRCTSTKQKKSGAQAGLFLWWRCRESNPGP